MVSLMGDVIALLKRTQKYAHRTTVMFPNEVYWALKSSAEKQDTTMSYIITELLMDYLDIDPADIPGRRPAKTKTERKAQLAERKKGKKNTVTVAQATKDKLYKIECNCCGRELELCYDDYTDCMKGEMSATFCNC
jgi:hypothetical protein